MKVGQVVKAKQILVKPQGTNVRTRTVIGKIFYINKHGIIWLDLGKYKESFYLEDIIN